MKFQEIKILYIPSSSSFIHAYLSADGICLFNKSELSKINVPSSIGSYGRDENVYCSAEELASYLVYHKQDLSRCFDVLSKRLKANPISVIEELKVFQRFLVTINLGLPTKKMEFGSEVHLSEIRPLFRSPPPRGEERKIRRPTSLQLTKSSLMQTAGFTSISPGLPSVLSASPRHYHTVDQMMNLRLQQESLIEKRSPTYLKNKVPHVETISFYSLSSPRWDPFNTFSMAQVENNMENKGDYSLSPEPISLVSTQNKSPEIKNSSVSGRETKRRRK